MIPSLRLDALCVCVALLAGCAAATEGEAEDDVGADCADGTCDQSSDIKPLPVEVPMKAAPNDIKLVQVKATGPLAAAFRTAKGTTPTPVQLWVAVKGNDVATTAVRTEPYLRFTPPGPGNYDVGIDNRVSKSSTTAEGTLSVGTPEYVFCTKQPALRCDGTVLRICGTSVETGAVGYAEIDCANLGGCDAVKGKCKSSKLPMWWCEGNTSHSTDEGQFLFANDCSKQGLTCREGACQ